MSTPRDLHQGFAIDPRFRGVLRLFGVATGHDASVDLDDSVFTVRFGHWAMRTPVANLAGAQIAGPFSALKALGVRLSLADRGITFGTNAEHGVCLRFHRPVPGIEPFGLLRHPGVTVTVEDPDTLVQAVAQRRAATPGERAPVTAPATRVTPQPGLVRRLVTVLRFPLGLAISTTRYLWWASEFHRTESIGDAGDLPDPLPAELVDDQVKTVDDGVGPLFHRRFRVRIRDSALGARALIDTIAVDLDRAAPSEVVSFRKQRGELGALQVGDEYRVRMPAPWDGPVRVVHRDATSFRFDTLAGHLEAGQIEFRAQDTADGVVFEIEVWSRAGDRLAFDQLRIGKKIQLHMWAQFCLSAGTLARGHRDDVITVDTRRAPWPPHSPTTATRSASG